MKSKFFIDVLFILAISAVVSILTIEFYAKPYIAQNSPKIAVLGLSADEQYQDVIDDPEKLRELATKLQDEARELTKNGYIVIDDSAIVSAPEQYRAN